MNASRVFLVIIFESDRGGSASGQRDGRGAVNHALILPVINQQGVANPQTDSIVGINRKGMGAGGNRENFATPAGREVIGTDQGTWSTSGAPIVIDGRIEPHQGRGAGEGRIFEVGCRETIG